MNGEEACNEYVGYSPPYIGDFFLDMYTAYLFSTYSCLFVPSPPPVEKPNSEVGAIEAATCATVVVLEEFATSLTHDAVGRLKRYGARKNEGRGRDGGVRNQRTHIVSTPGRALCFLSVLVVGSGPVCKLEMDNARSFSPLTQRTDFLAG